ncbi:MAG: alpha-amylase, partial [Muribaculaceae bacterium]|nr:alpha-amylase [Muribaculaceae bacterium]
MKMKAKYYLATALLAAACHAGAAGWPASYEGVMLQGFYWDSFTDTRWTNLESQADELSQYFSLIWVPQSAKAASNPGMGYDPVYWFSNYTSSFGNEAQLRSMINTFKDKGTGIIADVVVNHRSGVSNWTNFPKETWNGKTYQLGPEHICSTDEVRNAAGQATPTGAPDTGEDFDGSRDLDHTNATVQD